jgi:deazaflavin-dependent oxidoreductase (nitroreductase family)
MSPSSVAGRDEVGGAGAANRARVIGLLPRSWFYGPGRATALGRATSRFLAGWAALGLPTGRQIGLEVTGRRTGRPHTLAVVVAEHEGQDYLVSMVGEGDWVKNVHAAGGAATLVGTRRRPIYLEKVAVQQRAPIIQAYVRAAPGGRRHMGLSARATLAECDRVAHLFPVFRIIYESRQPSPPAGARDREGGQMGWTASPLRRWLRRQRGARGGVWLIKHVVAPLDRPLYRLTGGRILSTGRPFGPVLLLSTIGGQTGRVRTTPVFYVRDGERLVVCNVNPGFERPNPWTLNLRAHPVARVQVGKATATYRARIAMEEELERYWPYLVAVWPAYETHYRRSGQRVLFVLEPTPDAFGSQGRLLPARAQPSGMSRRDVVDGKPGTRFLARFRRLLEVGFGLHGRAAASSSGGNQTPRVAASESNGAWARGPDDLKPT